MNQLFLSLCLTLVTIFTFSQNKLTKEKIASINNQKDIQSLTVLAQEFDKIGDQQKTDWLPYYYAALCILKEGKMLYSQEKTDLLDPIAEQADTYIAKAEKLSPDNAELFILKKMASRYRMLVSPMTRYLYESSIAREALTKAKELDPNNPRVTLLVAEDVFYTPVHFGGDPEKGKELFKKAIAQFDSYQTKGELYPKWGKEEAESILKSN